MGTWTPAMSTVRGCSIWNRVDGVLVWAAVAGFAPLVSAELGGAARDRGAACGDTLASAPPEARYRSGRALSSRWAGGILGWRTFRSARVSAALECSRQNEAWFTVLCRSNSRAGAWRELQFIHRAGRDKKFTGQRISGPQHSLLRHPHE
jgi:hypothetical protein